MIHFREMTMAKVIGNTAVIFTRFSKSIMDKYKIWEMYNFDYGGFVFLEHMNESERQRESINAFVSLTMQLISRALSYKDVQNEYVGNNVILYNNLLQTIEWNLKQLMNAEPVVYELLNRYYRNEGEEGRTDFLKFQTFYNAQVAYGKEQVRTDFFNMQLLSSSHNLTLFESGRSGGTRGMSVCSLSSVFWNMVDNMAGTRTLPKGSDLLRQDVKRQRQRWEIGNLVRKLSEQLQQKDQIIWTEKLTERLSGEPLIDYLLHTDKEEYRALIHVLTEMKEKDIPYDENSSYIVESIIWEHRRNVINTVEGLKDFLKISENKWDGFVKNITKTVTPSIESLKNIEMFQFESDTEKRFIHYAVLKTLEEIRIDERNNSFINELHRMEQYFSGNYAKEVENPMLLEERGNKEKKLKTIQINKSRKILRLWKSIEKSLVQADKTTITLLKDKMNEYKAVFYKELLKINSDQSNKTNDRLNPIFNMEFFEESELAALMHELPKEKGDFGLTESFHHESYAEQKLTIFGLREIAGKLLESDTLAVQKNIFINLDKMLSKERINFLEQSQPDMEAEDILFSIIDGGFKDEKKLVGSYPRGFSDIVLQKVSQNVHELVEYLKSQEEYVHTDLVYNSISQQNKESLNDSEARNESGSLARQEKTEVPPISQFLHLIDKLNDEETEKLFYTLFERKHWFFEQEDSISEQYKQQEFHPKKWNYNGLSERKLIFLAMQEAVDTLWIENMAKKEMDTITQNQKVVDYEISKKQIDNLLELKLILNRQYRTISQMNNWNMLLNSRENELLAKVWDVFGQDIKIKLTLKMKAYSNTLLKEMQNSYADLTIEEKNIDAEQRANVNRIASANNNNNQFVLNLFTHQEKKELLSDLLYKRDKQLNQYYPDFKKVEKILKQFYSDKENKSKSMKVYNDIQFVSKLRQFYTSLESEKRKQQLITDLENEGILEYLHFEPQNKNILQQLYSNSENEALLEHLYSDSKNKDVQKLLALDAKSKDALKQLYLDLKSKDIQKQLYTDSNNENIPQQLHMDTINENIQQQLFSNLINTSELKYSYHNSEYKELFKYFHGNLQDVKDFLALRLLAELFNNKNITNKMNRQVNSLVLNKIITNSINETLDKILDSTSLSEGKSRSESIKIHSKEQSGDEFKEKIDADNSRQLLIQIKQLLEKQNNYIIEDIKDWNYKKAEKKELIQAFRSLDYNIITEIDRKAKSYGRNLYYYTIERFHQKTAHDKIKNSFFDRLLEKEKNYVLHRNTDIILNTIFEKDSKEQSFNLSMLKHITNNLINRQKIDDYYQPEFTEQQFEPLIKFHKYIMDHETQLTDATFENLKKYSIYQELEHVLNQTGIKISSYIAELVKYNKKIQNSDSLLEIKESPLSELIWLHYQNVSYKKREIIKTDGYTIANRLIKSITEAKQEVRYLNKENIVHNSFEHGLLTIKNKENIYNKLAFLPESNEIIYRNDTDRQNQNETREKITNIQLQFSEKFEDLENLEQDLTQYKHRVLNELNKIPEFEKKLSKQEELIKKIQEQRDRQDGGIMTKTNRINNAMFHYLKTELYMEKIRSGLDSK